MRFKVLGPLVVERAGHSVRVPGSRQRALLVALLLRAGKVVSAERLIDDVWAGSPPADPAHALQEAVSRLRRVLEDDGRAENHLIWHPSGYQLAVDPNTIDLSQFEQLAELGRRQLAAGDPAAAADTLRRGLDLWRGPALGDVADLPFGQAAAVRLEERRLAAVEDRIEADLRRGQHAAVVVELEGLVAEHPFRERLSGQLMRTLYAGGRQADALNLYESTRRMLADQLGVDPGPQLRSVYQQILVHDNRLTPPPTLPHGPSLARRSNLPASVTSFIGRDDDVRKVWELLEASRLVTLTGPGGVGKTRLALHAAGELVDAAVDGVWWVDLTPVGEAKLLADAVLNALEDQPVGWLTQHPRAAARPEDRLRTLLADRDLILVLDNCEHLADAVAEIVATILAAAPGTRILATSQRSLNTTGEAVWSVPPMPVPPAGADVPTSEVLGYAGVRLFVDRAAAASGVYDFGDDGSITEKAAEVAAVADICRTLDGVPLALELAAARTRLLPPRQLLGQLRDRFTLLTTGSATGPVRQRTLRAVVDWSYQLLTTAERVLLRRLAVFVGGASLNAVEHVCTDADPAAGLSPEMIIGLLAGLIDKSLLTVVAADGEARYTMLETIRAYATEELLHTGEETALRVAHSRYYADLAAGSVPQLHGPDQLHWLRLLTGERANMGTAIEHASGRGDGGTALRLAGALSQFWWLTGDVTDSRRLTTLALHAADPEPSADRAAALTFVGWLDTQEESIPELLSLLEEAAECYRSIGDRDGAALPTALLAEELRRQGQLQRSQELVAQPPTGAGWSGAVAQMLFGSEAIWYGDLRQAEQQLTAALARFRDLGDRWGQAESLYLLGGLAHIRGRYEQALQALDEAAELARHLGNTEQTIKLLSIAGNILVLAGDYPAALTRHEEALRLAQRLNLQSEIAFIRNGMGLSARRQGDYPHARAHHEHALAIYRRAHWQSGAALTHAWLGYTAELEGDAAQAEVHHIESLDIARETGDPRAVALPLEGLAGVAALRGDYQRCATLLGAATALRESLDAPLPAAERVDVDRASGVARSHLGESAFDLAFERGAAMALDAAYHYATTFKPTQ